MPDISTIQDQIRARLAELDELIEPLRREADQLKQITASLQSQPAATPRPVAPARPRTARPVKTRRRRTGAVATSAKRGRPTGSGNRAQQAIAKIREQPGITASELAQAMGINANYLYRVLPRLEKEAVITKKGHGYHPAPDTTSNDFAPTQPAPRRFSRAIRRTRERPVDAKTP